MKLIKTLKNLKFWSKSNKKKIKTVKNHRHSLPPPPPPCCYCHNHHHDGSHTVQPSAPPLPDWLDYEQQTYNQHLLASDMKFSSSSLSGFPISYQPQLDPPEEDESRSKAPIEPKVTSSSGFPISYEARLDTEEEDELKSKAPIEPIIATSSSYQQYMVENPVYTTVPVLQSRRRERSVGCVFDIGAHLFRCVFPCFRVREV